MQWQKSMRIEKMSRCITVMRVGLKIWFWNESDPHVTLYVFMGGLGSLSYRVSRKRSEHHSIKAFVERADALLPNQLSQDVPETVGIFALRSCGSNTNTRQTFCRRSRWRTWQRLTHRSGNETSARREESPRPSWRSLPSRRQTECWERWAPSDWTQQQVYYTQSRSSWEQHKVDRPDGPMQGRFAYLNINKRRSCDPTDLLPSGVSEYFSHSYVMKYIPLAGTSETECDSCQSSDISVSEPLKQHFHVFILPWTAQEPINILQ